MRARRYISYKIVFHHVFRIFFFSMDRLSPRRYVHVVPRHGQRLHNEDQHVRGHRGHGEPDGVGKGPDHSGRRMRRLLHPGRKLDRTRKYHDGYYLPTMVITVQRWLLPSNDGHDQKL